MGRPGLACVDCAGGSGSIHYAESILSVFSWNSSFSTYISFYQCVYIMIGRADVQADPNLSTHNTRFYIVLIHWYGYTVWGKGCVKKNYNYNPSNDCSLR